MFLLHRRSLITLAIVAAIMPGTILGCVAQSPAMSVANCSDAFLNLTGCLSYTAVGSNDTSPSGDCCPELAGLLDSNAICLCELLAGGAQRLGIALIAPLPMPPLPMPPRHADGELVLRCRNSCCKSNHDHFTSSRNSNFGRFTSSLSRLKRRPGIT
ncbi:non-specific lipid transfer protein GPI-anchored 12-like isoform X2 [Zingiber officinale]|nr:non-specific lipid transfer protein GPI-anchored 12-like isoform X2 [Zingiber officinale]